MQNLTSIRAETVEILTILAICTFSKWVIYIHTHIHTYIHEIEELTGVAFTKQRLLKSRKQGYGRDLSFFFIFVRSPFLNNNLFVHNGFLFINTATFPRSRQ